MSSIESEWNPDDSRKIRTVSRNPPSCRDVIVSRLEATVQPASCKSWLAIAQIGNTRPTAFLTELPQPNKARTISWATAVSAITLTLRWPIPAWPPWRPLSWQLTAVYLENKHHTLMELLDRIFVMSCAVKALSYILKNLFILHSILNHETN